MMMSAPQDDRPHYEVKVLTDGATILRISDVIISPIDPSGHIEVREGDIWVQSEQQPDAIADTEGSA